MKKFLFLRATVSALAFGYAIAAGPTGLSFDHGQVSIVSAAYADDHGGDSDSGGSSGSGESESDSGSDDGGHDSSDDSNDDSNDDSASHDVNDDSNDDGGSHHTGATGDDDSGPIQFLIKPLKQLFTKQGS